MAADALEANVRESFGKVVHSHKTHEMMVDQLNDRICLVKWSKLVLMFATTAAIVTDIFDFFQLGMLDIIVAAITCSLALGTTIYQIGVNPERMVQEHKRAMHRLWVIREDYANLIGDIHDKIISEKVARARRDSLLQRLGAVYADCPDVNHEAYEAARKALKINEEMTFSSQEIDQFLPAPLRRSKQYSLGGYR